MNPNRRNLVKTLGATAFASALTTSLAATLSAAPASLESALSAIADQAMRDMASPGIQICAWKEQSPVAMIAKGFANVETSTAVTSSTIFRAGSLTKQFTAALIAKLQEEGILSVQDRLDRHLDAFRGKRAPTLLELIHHTAGVHDQQDSTASFKPVSQTELARRIAEQAKVYDFPPGSAWLYSNANYILLGAVIESATNMSLAEAARKLIFDPLRLDSTRFDTNPEIVKGRASGYSFSDGGEAFINAECMPVEQAGGAGAIRATATDLCLWHQSLFSGRLVSSEALELLTAPARLNDGRPATEGRFDPNDNNMGKTSYGYGLLLDRSAKNGGLIAMHNGFINGFSAYLATHVPSMLTVACMCNSDPSQNLPFRQLRRAVFRPYLQES